jgi:putative transposase
MEHYRTSAPTRFDLKYPLVWITKHRKAILGGPVGLRLRELVVEVCKTNDVEILQGHISKDHVHLFVSVPPHLAPSKLRPYLKGKSRRKLAREFQHIQKAFWGRHSWARGYFGASSGNVTDEVIREDIRLQETDEPADGGANFRVVDE